MTYHRDTATASELDELRSQLQSEQQAHQVQHTWYVQKCHICLACCIVRSTTQSNASRVHEFRGFTG